MTKEISIHQPSWLNMTLERAMQSAEAQQEMAEYLAPRMQQFMSDIQTVADAFNKAMEPYRELGRQMAKVMQTYQKQAEQIGRAIRMAQPYVDAINREIERRNVIVSDQIIDVEPVDTEDIVEIVPIGKTIISSIPKRADFLCDRVAFWSEEGLLFFQTVSGWSVESIGNQTVAIILKLREKAQDADHSGLKAKEMGGISSAKEKRARNRVVLNRIRELRNTCKKYGAPNIIVHEELTCRWRYNPDLLLSPDKFSRALTKCSQDER